MRYLDYEQMVDAALLQVVRQALSQVSQKGLKEGHYFLITFLTQYPGVQVSEKVAQQYPEEITIVIQHEFWNLTVNEHNFSVDLSFGEHPETISVPFKSILHISDPGSNFELEFNPTIAQITTLHAADTDSKLKKTKPKRDESSDKNPGTIISLDQFRKK